MAKKDLSNIQPEAKTKGGKKELVISLDLLKFELAQKLFTRFGKHTSS